MSNFANTWAKAAESVEDVEVDPPTGEYYVEIIEATAEITRNGSELAKVRLRIYEDRHITGAFEHVMFFSSEFSAKQSAKALHGYGLDVAKITDFDDLGPAMAELVGAKVRVQVEHRDYQGRDFTDVIPLEVLSTPKRTAVAAVAADDQPPF